MNQLGRETAGRLIVATGFGLASHLFTRRRRSGHCALGQPRCAATRARPAGHQLAAGAIALAGPASIIVTRARGRQWAVRMPPSATGRALLGGYILAGVLAEELLWRAPLTWPLPARVRLALGVAGTASFAALHPSPAAGGSRWPHVITGASWTASTLTTGKIGWSVLGHVAYNTAAYLIEPDETANDPANPSGQRKAQR
jgi:hypothetical protein